MTLTATMPPTARPSPSNTIYVGTFVHCTSQTNVEVLTDRAIGVDEAGIIRFVWDAGGSLADDKIRVDSGWQAWKVVRADDGGIGFFFPGFIGKLQRSSLRGDYQY